MRKIRNCKAAKVIICLIILGIILSIGMVSFAGPEQLAADKPEPAVSVAPTVGNGRQASVSSEPVNTMEMEAQSTAAGNEPEAVQDNQPDTAVQPIAIASAEDLSRIGYDSAYPLDGIYELSGNIAGNGAAFRPIGSAQEPFTGELRGNGHCISGLTIAGDTAGLFSVLAGRVENLSVTDANVHGATQAGVLAGRITDDAVIENVYLSGSVISDGAAGGIAGMIENATKISSVQVAATVAGLDGAEGAVAGICRVPAEAFHAVIWSDFYGAPAPFGQTSPQQEGPITIMTEPLQVDLQAGSAMICC